MWIEVFNDNPYGTNCWLLSAEGNDEAVVVDPGFEPSTVRGLLEAAGKQPAAVVLTHAHIDHAGEAGSFAGDDVPVYIHPADALAYSDPVAWGRADAPKLADVKDLRTMHDGDVLEIANLALQVLHTPGHTPGHCVFRMDADGLVLSGDLVFAGTIGRSDLPESDPVAMARSLGRFLELSDELDVYPGHGRTTTVGRERTSNPFLVDR